MVFYVLVSLLLLLIGEGVFGLGLVLPWLWWVEGRLGEENGKEGGRVFFWRMWVLGLGIWGSVITGSILGGLSGLWLGGLGLFSLARKVFAQRQLMVTAGMVLGLSFLGDRWLGLWFGMIEAGLILLWITLLYFFSKGRSGIYVRRG